MSDFERRDSPADISSELRRVGIDPDRAVERRSVRPSLVEASEWNRLGTSESKVERYASNWSDDVPPVLLVDEGRKYKVVDGLHRAEAAKRIGRALPALVIGERVYDHIYNFGDTAMYEWAHEVAP